MLVFTLDITEGANDSRNLADILRAVASELEAKGAGKLEIDRIIYHPTTGHVVGFYTRKNVKVGL